MKVVIINSLTAVYSVAVFCISLAALIIAHRIVAAAFT